MNKLDKQYTDLLQDILDNGYTKSDRTGTGTISAFGRQIRHKMSDGFPLLTTKKMAWKSIVTELLWFLRGDTNIKFLVDNGCHIWDGDAYKRYTIIAGMSTQVQTLTQEEFINKIKTDDEFAKKWGELGPIYGKQWRHWAVSINDELDPNRKIPGGYRYSNGEYSETYIDQIANLINDLKNNPDSRRLMVNAWNVGELDQMVLPPCHYGFQVYTRELSFRERMLLMDSNSSKLVDDIEKGKFTQVDVKSESEQYLNEKNIPTRAISLMWNQRSCDTFLGIPFNIASYGLLLEIIAKAVNMVPDELIGNLGDVHLYSNHIEQAKEQIGRDLSMEERIDYALSQNNFKFTDDIINGQDFEKHNIPKRTREPYPLPTLNINTEFWSYEGGECGVGPLDAVKVFESFKNENFCRCLLEEDIQLSNYQSHPAIKAPLSN